MAVVERYAAEAEGGADHSHQGSAGNEAGSDEGAFFTALFVGRRVFASCGYIPVDESAGQQRQVQLQRDEHAQGKGQSRHVAGCQHDGDDGTYAIEQPGGTGTAHQWFDDGGHGVGLRCCQLPAGEPVGLVQNHDDTGYGGCRYQCAQKFEGLLFLRGAAQPIAYLQIGDETARRGKGRTDDTAHDECGHHARRTFQAHRNHDDRGQNQCHQRHA